MTLALQTYQIGFSIKVSDELLEGSSMASALSFSSRAITITYPQTVVMKRRVWPQRRNLQPGYRAFDEPTLGEFSP